MSNNLTISWKKDELTPINESYYWPSRPRGPSRQTCAEEPESKRIDSKVMTYLQRALKIGLKRNQAWNLSSIDCEQEQRIAAFAASIYYRGVPVISTVSLQDDEAKLGSYAIRIHSQTESCETWIDKYVVKYAPIIIADQALAPMFEKMSATTDLYLCAEEKLKTIETVNRLCQILETAKAGKRICLIIGGGIVCDIAAFAASISGIEFHLVPSTLLAMVDASVGGKSGVNVSGYGKNIVGRFSFPIGVEIFPKLLDSLPNREIASAGAECLKHSFLSYDYTFAKEVCQAISQHNLKCLAELLPSLIKVKANIISEDPFEHGKRAILNFGHTLGHALESLSQEQYPTNRTLKHGEAVAIGMLFALHLSKSQTGVNHQSIYEMQGLVKKAFIIPSQPELETMFSLKMASLDFIQALLSYTEHDKKNKNEASSDKSIALVLIKDWAQAYQPCDHSYTVKFSKLELRKHLSDFFRDFLNATIK